MDVPSIAYECGLLSASRKRRLPRCAFVFFDGLLLLLRVLLRHQRRYLTGLLGCKRRRSLIVPLTIISVLLLLIFSVCLLLRIELLLLRFINR